MMPPITPYLTIKGCDAAIAFYKKAFGATENARLPAQDGKRLMHADITITGANILMSEEFLEHADHGAVAAPTVEKPSPVAVALHFKAPAEVDTAFKRAIDAGCKSVTAPADMFWNARFAMLNDPFGHRWMMNAPLPAK